MSDQPKPTSEWTVDEHGKLRSPTGERFDNVHHPEHLKDEINAAIAVRQQHIDSLDKAERAERDEARAQRDWLIKECGRIGVTVNVQIGAPITQAYRLVNAAQQPLVDALKEQQELWAMASVQLNAMDDKAHSVRFMEFHRPLGKISAALAKVNEGK